jgi:hypothetical protein
MGILRAFGFPSFQGEAAAREITFCNLSVAGPPPTLSKQAMKELRFRPREMATIIFAMQTAAAAPSLPMIARALSIVSAAIHLLQ